MSDKLQHALGLATLGLYVFPLEDDGKRPRPGFTGWESRATLVEAQIKAWWEQWPAANIGIACGPSDIVVIDVDPAHGGDIDGLGVSELEKATAISVTGGGGYHYFYRQPQGVKFGNGNTMPPGLDARGVGGYVVGPGSLHPDTGKVYQWAAEADSRLNILPLPYTIGYFLKPKGTRKTPTEQKPAPVDTTLFTNAAANASAYARAALKNELDILAATRAGDRNNQLNRAAFNLGQLVGAGLLTEYEVVSPLHRVAEQIGLHDSEVQKTVQSGLKAGMAEPRQVPSRMAFEFHDSASGKPAVADIKRRVLKPERALLNAALIDQTAFMTVSEQIQPTDLLDDNCRTVYEAMLGLFKEQKQYNDPALLFDVLTREGADPANVYRFLQELYQDIGLDGLDDYIQIVRRGSSVITLTKMLDQLQEAVSQPDADPADIQTRSINLFLDMQATAQTAGLRPIDIATEQMYDEIEDFFSQQATIYLPTGIPEVDRCFDGGLFRGGTTLLMGETGRGKTALALNIANSLSIKRGVPGGIFNMEMDAPALVRRIAAMRSEIDSKKLQDPAQLSDDDWTVLLEETETISQSLLYIDDNREMDLEYLNYHIYRAVIRHQLEYVIVDYFTLLEMPDQRNRFDAITQTSRGLSNLAKRLGIPIIIIVSPKRETSKGNKPRRMTESDIYGGQHVANDASQILILQDPRSYDAGDISQFLIQAGRNLVVLETVKNRNGKTSYCPIVFEKHFQRFRSAKPLRQQAESDIQF